MFKFLAIIMKTEICLRERLKPLKTLFFILVAGSPVIIEGGLRKIITTAGNTRLKMFDSNGPELILRTFSLHASLPLSLSLFLFLYLYFYLFLYLSMSISISLSLSLTLILSVSHSISFSHFPYHSLPLSHNLSPST